MTNSTSSRREFLCDTISVAGGAALLAATGAAAQAERGAARSGGVGGRLHVACNQYSWSVFYQRDGKDFNQLLDAGFGDVKASGLDGFEPGVGGLEQISPMIPLLKQHRLAMRSLYVNSTLHEPDQVDKSIEQVLAAAAKAKEAGTEIIVTNPSPIRWGGPENKTDAQLRTQAAALDRLGGELRRMGLILAYHNHDIELRNAAREFHHMMNATGWENVKLCLDAHWIYRGAGNSQVALFDVLKLYSYRIVELHLRQSQNGVWTEVFGPGDIDYPRLADHLRKGGVKPLLVLEQAIEAGSPNTTRPVEAFQKSTAYVREVFAGFGG